MKCFGEKRDAEPLEGLEGGFQSRGGSRRGGIGHALAAGSGREGNEQTVDEILGFFRLLSSFHPLVSASTACTEAKKLHFSEAEGVDEQFLIAGKREQRKFHLLLPPPSTRQLQSLFFCSVKPLRGPWPFTLLMTNEFSAGTLCSHAWIQKQLRSQSLLSHFSSLMRTRAPTHTRATTHSRASTHTRALSPLAFEM